jgi:hypothetical protein
LCYCTTQYWNECEAYFEQSILKKKPKNQLFQNHEVNLASRKAFSLIKEVDHKATCKLGPRTTTLSQSMGAEYTGKTSIIVRIIFYLKFKQI